MHEPDMPRSAPPPNQADVHAFHYPDAPNGVYRRCPIRLLRGMSPARQALMRSEFWQIGLRPYRPTEVPFARITFDQLGDEARTGDETTDLSLELYDQFAELPDNAQRLLRVVSHEHLIVVSIPVTPQGRLVVGYRRNRLALPIVAQFLADNDEGVIDLVSYQGGRQSNLRIADVYAIAQTCALQQHAAQQESSPPSSGGNERLLSHDGQE